MSCRCRQHSFSGSDDARICHLTGHSVRDREVGESEDDDVQTLDRADRVDLFHRRDGLDLGGDEDLGIRLRNVLAERHGAVVVGQERVADTAPAAGVEAAPGHELFDGPRVLDEREDDPLGAVVEERPDQPRPELRNANDRRYSCKAGMLDRHRHSLEVDERVLEIDPDEVETGLGVEQRDSGMEERSLGAEHDRAGA